MRLPAAVLLLASLATEARAAEEWVSPAGVVAVSVPDPAVFEETAPVEPFLALWVSRDGRQRLGVLQSPVPPGKPIVRKYVEDGFLGELNGRMIASTVEVIDGYTVLRMSAAGQMQGAPMTMHQSLVGVDDTIYKVMAAVDGDEFASQEHARAFVGSLRVLAAGRNDRLRAQPEAPAANRDDEWINKLSGRLGLYGILLLLVCVGILRSRRHAKQKPPQ